MDLLTTFCELVGLALIAACVFVLAGFGWGLGAAGCALILFSLAATHRPARSQ